MEVQRLEEWLENRRVFVGEMGQRQECKERESKWKEERRKRRGEKRCVRVEVNEEDGT